MNWVASGTLIPGQPEMNSESHYEATVELHYLAVRFKLLFVEAVRSVFFAYSE